MEPEVSSLERYTDHIGKKADKLAPISCTHAAQQNIQNVSEFIQGRQK